MPDGKRKVKKIQISNQSSQGSQSVLGRGVVLVACFCYNALKKNVKVLLTVSVIFQMSAINSTKSAETLKPLSD